MMSGISREAYLDRERRLLAVPWWHKFFRLTGIGLLPQQSWPSSSSKTKLYVLNGISGMQGPNYALAKTSQQWRAIVARADGHVVSANHAIQLEHIHWFHIQMLWQLQLQLREENKIL